MKRFCLVLFFTLSVSSWADEGLRLKAGLGLLRVEDRGFDRFASYDGLSSFNAEGTRPIYQTPKGVISLGLSGSLLAIDGSARGANTNLALLRVTVPLELRWKFSKSFHAFTQVGAGAMISSVQVSLPEGNTAQRIHFPWAVDSSAGVMLKLFSVGKSSVWFVPEVGHAWTATFPLNPVMTRELNPIYGQNEPLNLGTLGVNGWTGKFSFAWVG